MIEKSKDVGMETIRVLLLENDQAGSARVGAQLKKDANRPIALEVCSTLKAGVEAIQHAAFDLLLIDMALPDSQGVDTLDRLFEAAEDIPVVVLSEEDNQALANQCIEKGAQDYIVKGEKEHLLISMIFNTIARVEAQKALTLTHANIERMITDQPDAVLVLDDEDNIRYANPAASELFRGRAKNGINFGMPLGDPEGQELDVPDIEGRLSTVEMRVSSSTWHGENARVVSFRDVTERYAAIKRIESLHYVARAVRHLSRLIVHERDPQRLIQKSCELLVETCGFDGAWIMYADDGKTPSMIGASGWNGERAPFDDMLAAGEWPSCRREARIAEDGIAFLRVLSACGNCPASSLHSSKCSAVTELYHGETLKGVMGIALSEAADMATDEERSFFKEIASDVAFALHNLELEQQREETERILDETGKMAKIGGWYHDLETGRATWTKAIFDIVQIPYTETPPGAEAHLSFYPPVDREILKRAYDWAVTHGEPFDLALRGYTAKQDPIWCRVQGEPIMRDGKCVALRGTFQDISTQKQAEEKRDTLEAQLRQSQKMESIGRLAGGIAHDFNNLLTVINSYSEFTYEDLRDGDPLKQNLKQILGAGERAAALTRQLLAFSRRQVMEPKVVDLNDIVQDVKKMLHRMIGEDIELNVELDAEIGRVHVDPGQLEQVLMNLAVNARDAMPDGGRLTVETADVELDETYADVHPDTTPGPYVMLAVTDNGVGMTREVQERIFEPFFTTKEKGQGTGLGLATVFGIVKQSEGNIWVYSEPGKGTTFKIYLPRVSAPKTSQWPEKPLTDDFKGTETILLVEDDAAVRQLTERILRTAGYQVIAAANGGEALLDCEKQVDPIHLIVTDVVMPKMSGRELTDRLAQVSPGLKALYMSGYTGNEILHRGVLDEGVRFIAKPFTARKLLEKVRRVLDEA